MPWLLRLLADSPGCSCQWIVCSCHMDGFPGREGDPWATHCSWGWHHESKPAELSKFHWEATLTVPLCTQPCSPAAGPRFTTLWTYNNKTPETQSSVGSLGTEGKSLLMPVSLEPLFMLALGKVAFCSSLACLLLDWFTFLLAFTCLPGMRPEVGQGRYECDLSGSQPL